MEPLCYEKRYLRQLCEAFCCLAERGPQCAGTDSGYADKQMRLFDFQYLNVCVMWALYYKERQSVCLCAMDEAIRNNRLLYERLAARVTHELSAYAKRIAYYCSDEFCWDERWPGCTGLKPLFRSLADRLRGLQTLDAATVASTIGYVQERILLRQFKAEELTPGNRKRLAALYGYEFAGTGAEAGTPCAVAGSVEGRPFASFCKVEYLGFLRAVEEKFRLGHCWLTEETYVHPPIVKRLMFYFIGFCQHHGLLLERSRKTLCQFLAASSYLGTDARLISQKVSEAYHAKDLGECYRPADPSLSIQGLECLLETFKSR